MILFGKFYPVLSSGVPVSAHSLQFSQFATHIDIPPLLESLFVMVSISAGRSTKGLLPYIHIGNSIP